MISVRTQTDISTFPQVWQQYSNPHVVVLPWLTKFALRTKNTKQYHPSEDLCATLQSQHKP